MSSRKESGSFYTPIRIAKFMVERALAHTDASTLRILEPSAGNGIFIDEILSSHFIKKNNCELDLVEINELEANFLEKKYHKYDNLNIFADDFLNFQCGNSNRYNLIIGNPPYIKRNHLNDKQMLLSKKVFEFFPDFTNTNIKNIWSIFLVRSISLLKENGLLAFVLPAELLQVDYANQLRQLLLKEFTRIEIFTFNELLFQDCKGQDTLILIAYKSSKDPGLFFTNINNTNDLANINSIKFVKHSITEKKWSSHTLNEVELKLINKLVIKSYKIGDICTSKTGIVTAANSFFIINKDTLNNFSLKEYSKPIIQKGSIIGNRINFTNKDFHIIESANLPCYFIDFNKPCALNDKKIETYLHLGVEQNLHTRYKMLNRANWFQVPHTGEAAPLLFFKRCHEYPKLIKNEADILATDSAYLTFPCDSYEANSIVFSFYNSFTLACAELMGRYYGGGVLELTPKEFKSLPLPYIEIDKCKFSKYVSDFNNKHNLVQILQKYNEIILKSFFPEITDDEIELLEHIRLKLVKRRQRL